MLTPRAGLVAAAAAVEPPIGPGPADLDDAFGMTISGVGNLLAAWRMGDASGATLTDASGNGRHGSYVGTPLYAQAALAFASSKTSIRTNGAGYGQVTHVAALAPAAGAFGVWFQVLTLASQTTVAHKGAACQITVETSGRIRLTWRGETIETPPGHAEVGVRNHALVAFDGTDVRFFVDGFLVGGLTEGSGLNLNVAAWQFGRSVAGTTGDVRLHEAVLYGTAKKTWAHAVALAEGQRGLAYRAPLRTVNVTSSATLNAAIAAAIPGDHIICANATYTAPTTLAADGTNRNQIVVKALNLGQAIISGSWTISGDWCVVEGFGTGTGGQLTISGSRSRITRCTRNLFTTNAIRLEGPTRFVRIDHCSLTNPNLNSGGAQADNANIEIKPENGAQHWLIDHLYTTAPNINLGNGRDFRVGDSAGDTAFQNYGFIYRSLFDNYDADEVISGKSSDFFVWYCTFINSSVYTQDRHGSRHEWRSSYWSGMEHNCFGDDDKFIGNTYNGAAALLRLGRGDCTQTQFAAGIGGRPACLNARIVGCTFSGGAKVDAGLEFDEAGVNAAGATAEGCPGWTVTYTASYTGTITHAPTTDQWFEAAVQLVAGDVGPAALDPLVPVEVVVDPIEAVSSSHLQVAISVQTAPRQTWIGYGWGAASINMAHWTAAAVTRLCEDMGATIVRYFTPETGAAFVSAHQAHWDLVSAHGINKIFASLFVYRTANAPQQAAGSLAVPANPPNIVGARNGLNTVIASINPSNGFYATLQNEPDGNQYNHPTPTAGGVGTATQAQIRAHYQTLKSGLNSSVKLLGLEYRHPQTLIPEFTEFNSSGVFTDGTVQGQCFHVYDDGARNEYYDDRLMPQGLRFFSTETGDLGWDVSVDNTFVDLTSPYCAARFIAAINAGADVEITHAAVGTVDNDGKVQSLIHSGTGLPRGGWYAQCKIISKHMIPGTVMRLCLSNDTPPTTPLMPAIQASRMIIDSSTCLCQPRQLVAYGVRPDGRRVLVAVNHAYDALNQTTFAGGHYAAPSGPGPNQQLTVTDTALVGVPRAWSGQRATRAGVETATTVNMNSTGMMRFTLPPGETIAITSA